MSVSRRPWCKYAGVMLPQERGRLDTRGSARVKSSFAMGRGWERGRPQTFPPMRAGAGRLTSPRLAAAPQPRPRGYARRDARRDVSDGVRVPRLCRCHARRLQGRRAHPPDAPGPHGTRLDLTARAGHPARRRAQRSGLGGGLPSSSRPTRARQMQTASFRAFRGAARAVNAHRFAR